jgi:hypothetical protein
MFLVLCLAKTSYTCKMNVCLGNWYAADFIANPLARVCCVSLYADSQPARAFQRTLGLGLTSNATAHAAPPDFSVVDVSSSARTHA